jgi:protein-S-isoprenylcysteine O-methyltransferase Ste14
MAEDQWRVPDCWRWVRFGRGRSALTTERTRIPPEPFRTAAPGATSIDRIEPLYLDSHTAHTVVSVSLGAWGLGELWLRLRNRGGEDHFEWTLVAVAGCVGLGVGLAFVAVGHRTAAFAGGWAPFLVGEALFLAGLALRYWSVHTLGRFFKVTVSIQAGHRVIRSGPYRLLRHPSYSGLLVAMLGLGLMLETWLGLVALIVLPLIGVLIRIRAEESALIDALGSEYASYAAETRRLIPGLW